MLDKEFYINRIINRVDILGITSCKKLGEDQFDNKLYIENMITEQVQGSNIIHLTFPHNDITWVLHNTRAINSGDNRKYRIARWY